VCGEDQVTTYNYRYDFEYGSGGSAVTLQVELPIRRCDTCDFEFLDQEGERIKHEAVCRHLGVLTSTEIRGIRERYGMSRASFAELTGLGEATLNRWENGVVIQNPANDRYLRLLSMPDVFGRLSHLPDCPFTSTEEPDPENRYKTAAHVKKRRPKASVKAILSGS
jgi:putative zinc finger/helix-turn-helix YgiT family protein